MSVTDVIDSLLKFEKIDDDGLVPIAVVSGVLGLQSQYVSGCFGTIFEDIGYPCLVDGLRVVVSPVNYHACRIHVDDIEEFVNRWYEAFPSL